MKPTMESSTSSTPTAETAMTEVVGRLSAIVPGTEILLALKTLRARETILIQLAQIRRGRGRTPTAQLP